MNGKPKILVILGPTASGKSALAVELAQKHNGEVVSADSRQVYRGLDIGSGKITEKEMAGVPHHLLDVADPQLQFSVSGYKKLAEKAIDEILAKGKLPIICGGTGFYIQSIVDGVALPEVPPNEKLRAELEIKTPDELFNTLLALDAKRAAEIDKRNKVRVIRAIEIATALGKVPEATTEPKYDAHQIGIKIDEETLRKNIEKRLVSRLQAGMIEEAVSLHEKGLSWQRMEALGLEYRSLAEFLQKKITREEMDEKIKFESWHYAKRQMTWFKRDTRIHWFTAGDLELKPI